MRRGGTRRRLATLGAAMLLSLGVVLAGAAPPAAAAGTLSLFKAIENLDTGASEGDRSRWDVQAVNLDTGETIRAQGLNGFQSRSVPAGRYRISELPNDRTPPGYRFRDWNCNGTIHRAPEPVITLADNQSLTCTVTNEAVRPTLTLAKEVEGGSADPALWTLRTLDGPVSFSGPANSPQVTNVPVRIGTYRLDESGGPGAYEPGSWDCEYTDHLGNAGDVPVDAQNRITIGLYQQVVCTITNTADTTQLTLLKEVTGSGGPLHDPADFTLTAQAPGHTLSGPSGSLDVTHADVQPGVEYAFFEEGPPGYESQGWECVADSGSFTGTPGTVTLDDGADVTCTVVNAFTGGWLTLAKEVEGSQRPATAWELTATGSGAAEGAEISGESGSEAVTRVPLPAGEYALAEEGPGGYLTDGFVCDGGTPGPTVTLGPGEDVTCVVTNTRDPELTQLTLAKRVDNTGGGPLPPTAWGLRAAHEGV